MGLFAELKLAEARTQQASIMVSQIPRANHISSDPTKAPYGRSDGNLNVTIDIGNNDTAPTDCHSNVGVHIERAIIRDVNPLDDSEESETTAGRDLYPPPISVQVWDETVGSKV